MKKLFLLCISLLIVVGAGVAAQPAKRNVGAILGEVQRSMALIGKISGDFIQEKKLALLKDPIVSTGKFTFSRPRSLTWEYLSPSPSGLKIENDKVELWTGPPEARIPQPASLAKPARMMADQVMLWMSFEPREIQALYDVAVIEEFPLTLKVIPKREGLRRFLKSITVVVEDDRQTVRTVTIEEKDGETVLTFNNVLLDHGRLTESAP